MPIVERFWIEQINGEDYYVGEYGSILKPRSDDKRLSSARRIGFRQNGSIQKHLTAFLSLPEQDVQGV